MTRGRPPKDPALRRSRQKVATAADLPARGDIGFSEVARPPLPAKLFAGEGKIHTETRKWWTAIWASEMAGRWLASDIPGLQRLAILVNQFYLAPSPRLSSEIRAIQDIYGLTPFGRKKLDWRIEGPRRLAQLERDEEPDEPTAPAPPVPGERDPRSVLRAVN
jgi:hypothetical protein